MAQLGQLGHAALAPPAVTSLRADAARNSAERGHMLRSISQDIREEREDLKKAAEQSLNAILELDLEGAVRWVSVSWEELTGARPSDVVGKPVADMLVGNHTVFADCLEAMRKDDSKSHFIRFLVKAADTACDLSADGKTPVDNIPHPHGPSSPEVSDPITSEGQEVELEAQGIMVYERTTGEESHTMWMVKPAVSREITIDLPQVLVDSLGVGAEMLANYLTLLADVGVQDPGNHPPPLPVLCRICERQITPWWFEKHSELCSQEHRAEMEVQMAQESLNEQRPALVRVLDALEAQSRSKQTLVDSGSPTSLPQAEYKGLSIGPGSAPTSNPSSGRASPAGHVSRSRESSTSGFGHHRARSFAVRRPLARIVELVLDLCDTAMEISTPSIKDTKAYAPGELRTQSPQSEGRIQQVLQWQSPSAGSLENEQGLSLMCDDTYRAAKTKVEAVFRHRRVLEYSERIRVEYDVLVQECIEAALQKAAQIAAGDMSDSSSGEDPGRYDTRDEQQSVASSELARDSEGANAMHMDDMYSLGLRRPSGSPSAMATALRKRSDPMLSRRASSAASSRASSPRGATTPKSYIASTEPFALHKRRSLAFESDTGADSDSSMRSSAASIGQRRADSPGAELSLSRVASTRSRDRKRQSLVLPSLVGSTRHQSPARGPPGPSSPLRMTKPRIPSGIESNPSPITSPVFTSEFSSPVIRAQHQLHHRRQSSAQLLEAMGRPASPRMSAVITNPQPRAVQTSIKDFEIIKPISKGAFGSVYLSKKKSTGDYFAIKVLKKADMVAKNQVTNVKAERAIMMWQGESDFVAKLYWTFSSKDYLYLVMEYLNGGDCASLIKVLGGLPEEWTKKYIGEVVLCVQHLHSRQIVHRDLKPDNLLIDANGHLKLTDFGLSRMGLIGRQKRAINAKPEDLLPDLLKAGPFRRAPSVTSSRSASLDYQGNSHSPAHTPSINPAYGSEPSYFSLYRENSREPSRRTSGRGSDSGESEALSSAFRKFSIAEGHTPIEEETASDEGGADSPDPYSLQGTARHASLVKTETPPQTSSMPPPIMALFDPEDNNRKFVGTPDYLAPETINGAGQDEMSDWWSLGCILFECLYGRPPFNADTPEEVFQNILARDINWPCEDDEDPVSEEAKDMMNQLMCLDPKKRLGANLSEKYADGGDEIKAHCWFADMSWDTLREDEASFIPMNGNPENTEYFDARGATMQDFAAEFEDQQSSPAQTPGADYPDRPHDALSRVRSQMNAVKRNLMPLHIPPHVRDARMRRLSEPVVADDFGSFQFKNLPVLEKANKDVIQKLRADAMQAQAKSSSVASAPSSAMASPSAAPSLESSPVFPGPLKRTLSANKGAVRPQSPSLLSQSSSPSRGSQPSSPLLVTYSTGQSQGVRKHSSGASSLSQQNSTTLQPGNFFDQGPRGAVTFKATSTPSPIKIGKPGSVQIPIHHRERSVSAHRHPSMSSPRQRSQTVGSQDQDGDLVPELIPNHHKRRSGVFPQDLSPSSSDTEETRHHQALLRVQRRRQSSRRLSQISLGDGPTFRTLDVLVCEDHPVSRFTMERLLEKLRCRTISVTNGSEAMRYAMSEVKFDIIMMEYKLPQVNGADVARMIRDTKNANSHTPIVAVTGYLKELQAPHHFDALVEKPPTKEKLEEVMGRLCQWRTPPEGWRPPPPQAIPPSNLRQESLPRNDSPTTTTSSGFNFSQVFSSYRGSSREDSIGSSSFGETDSHMDSIPVIISRQPTADWDQSDLERNFGGLGISGGSSSDTPPRRSLSPVPLLQHQSSAPAEMETVDHQIPRKQPSIEAIQAKRRSLEKRQESAAESGDDEDEELGHSHVRQRSPKRSGKRMSRLGIEMMRTNSQGSVVSNEDLVSPKDNVVETPAIVGTTGTLTPPVLFSPRPGDHTEFIDMDAVADAEATPRPLHTQEPDPDPTPRASTSPLP